MEEILKVLPLDNLYKFMALTGLVLTLFCVFYPDWRLAQLEKNSVELVTKQKIILAEYDQLEEDYKVLLKRREKYIKEAKELVKRFNDRAKASKQSGKAYMSYRDFTDIQLARYFKDAAFRESMKFVIDNYSFFREETEDDKITQKASQELTEKGHKLKIKGIESEALSSLLTIDEARHKKISLYGTLGTIVGLAISFIGFLGWYFKNQAPQDKLLSQQLTSNTNANP